MPLVGWQERVQVQHLSCGREAVCAFHGFEFFEDVADGSLKRLSASLLGVPQLALELGADLLDRVEIGVAGRKKELPCP